MIYTFDQDVPFGFDATEPTFDSTAWTFDLDSPWTFDSALWPTFDSEPVVVTPLQEGIGYWAPVYWHQAYYNEAYWADTHVTYARSGVIRLRLSRGLPKSLPLDYWKLFARETPEPVPDDVVVLLPGEEPPAPPVQPNPRRRKKPAPVVEEPPKKDQAVIDRRDIADLFALLGIVEQPKPDDEQDMTDILGVIGILETQ